MIEIRESKRKDNKKGKWLELKGLDEKGEARTWNVFDNYDLGTKIITELFKGPGKYNVKSEKEGQYWRFNEFGLVDLAGGSAAPSNGNGHGAPAPTPAPVAAQAPVQTRKIGRAELAVAALEAVGQVYYGTGKESSNDSVLTLRVFMTECANFIAGADKKPEGA